VADAEPVTDPTFDEAAKLRGKLPALVDKLTPEELAEFNRIMAEALAEPGE
jgi:hypothetical protein